MAKPCASRNLAVSHLAVNFVFVCDATLHVFLHQLGNWHVGDLLGSPSLDSILRHHLQHFSRLLCHLRHGNIENLIRGRFDVLLNNTLLNPDLGEENLEVRNVSELLESPLPDCVLKNDLRDIHQIVLSTAAREHRETAPWCSARFGPCLILWALRYPRSVHKSSEKFVQKDS